MQNKTLAITRQCIPYYKELRQVAGSVTASILMQQLDYWFSKQDGDQFYKFKAPCENEYYKSGDSFTEELGFSIEEFTNAFAKIGFSYKSKTEFENTADKFQGMFYCSYFDRKEGLTFYFRNHELLDSKLNELFTVKRESSFTENGKVHLQKTGKFISPIYITEEYNSRLQQKKDTASGFSESDFLENFIQKHLSKMSESEKAGFQTFAVTQLEQVSEKLGRLLTQQECLEHCKKILNVMYPQTENPTVKDSLTVQKPKQEVEVEIIPNCIDISKWEEWKNYKKEKKQKLTKSTAEKQLQNLQKWHLEGQDPNEIIDKSISNGWQGLFPLKQEKSNQSTFNNQNRKPKLSMSESADLIRQMAQYTKEQQEKLNPEEYADPF